MGVKKRIARGQPRKGETALAKWIDAAGVSRGAFADKLQTTRTHLDRLCQGSRRPSLEMALLIERLTHGGVPVAAWATVKPHTRD